MAGDFLLYGSTGYVARLVAELAAERGLHPVLAGRNPVTVSKQATAMGLDARIIEVGDRPGLEAAMADMPVVLNCAGPFIHTHESIVEACIGTGTHYLDLTGEPPVFASVAAQSDRAAAAGVMLLPAVGFDVAVTDALAVHLLDRMPGATHLTLAFHQDGPAPLPPGTLNTMIEMTQYGNTKQARVGGRVVALRERKTRVIDFGAGPVVTPMLTWGDVFTAYRSTGIPNIEVYVGLRSGAVKQLEQLDRMRPLFRFGPVRALAKRNLSGGATREQLAATSTSVFGEVADADGQTAVTRLQGPEAGKVWTARSALAVVQRVLAGEFEVGYHTPAEVYDPSLVFDADGVSWEDVV